MNITMDSVDKTELLSISSNLESKHPREILRWAVDTYGQKLTMTTAFQVGGCAIVAMLAEIGANIPLFNLDTGYQFKETLETRQRLVDKYGIPIYLVYPEQSVEEMERENGGPLYKSDPNLCCHKRKVVPLAETLVGFDAWITAIRREQAKTRSNAEVVGWDEKFQLAKINPLANWTKKELWEYVLKNDVPYNTLHDAGYPSIGCWPCTKSIGSNEDERAGRWAGTDKQECGLHIVNYLGENI